MFLKKWSIVENFLPGGVFHFSFFNFLYKRCSLKIVVSRLSLKDTRKGVFSSKVASRLAVTLVTEKLLNSYFSIILSFFREHVL